MQAALAISRRRQSGQSVRAMLQTACATTTTAVSMSPCSTACIRGPGSAGIHRAKAYMASAEGRVNPTQAANAPSHPARCKPTRNPTWLLVGPGNN